MIRLSNVSKQFENTLALAPLSVEAKAGRILGIIGPNGAGKTTTIRLILNILSPDSGTITFNNKKIDEAIKQNIGYLPEERGLYKKTKVKEVLMYFARLKGMSKADADVSMLSWLEYFNLSDTLLMKTDDLSKGMSQKIQFIASVIHDPDILILDEPFSGLDPVSVNQMREAIVTLRDKGKTILFSTHVMEQAERICNELLMLHKGKKLLYGETKDIKTSFGNTTIHLEFDGDEKIVLNHQLVKHASSYPRYVEVLLSDFSKKMEFLADIASKIDISRFECTDPSLHEIFISIIGAQNE